MSEAGDSPNAPPVAPAAFRQLAELSLDLLTISNAEGCFTWVNAAVTRTLGWSFEELTAKSYFELLHPDDRERTQAALGGVVRGETILDFENRYRHKDGSYRWLSWRCGPMTADGVLVATARDVTEYRQLREAAADNEWSQDLAEREAQLRAADGDLPPLRYRMVRANDGAIREIQATGGTRILDHAGELVSMAGALLDITDQVTAERALLWSEAQLREAQRMANVGHWRWEFATGTATWSEQMYRIYGAGPGQEMNAEAFYEYMHAEDRARVRQAARRAMEASEPFEISFRLLQIGDRTVRRVHMAAQPTRDAAGTTTGYIGIIHDTTEQYEAKEALLRSEWVLREAQQVAGIGSWTFDPTSGAVTWSDEMFRICGIPAGREPGMALHLDLVHAGDRAAVAKAGLATPTRDVPGIRYRIQRLSDGAIRHVSTATRVLRDDEGDALLIVGTTMDVTAQHRLEEELRQAQKMEAVGQLAGGVAHDFNNSLTAILGNAELARMSMPGGGDAVDSIDAVIDAAEQAAGVTRQLLAFARRQIVQPAVLEPGERLRAVQRLLRPMLGEEMDVHLHVEPDGARLRMDPGQFEQLLMNLAVNARDAMPRGGTLGIACARVTLGAHNAAGAEGVAPGEWVRLKVSDTGMGMDAATQERIFEPFYTTKETGRGTGLGLATCHGIMLQNGGHILVDSTPGTGTTFRLYFPHVDAGADESAGEPVNERNGSHGTEHILLVEDEARVLDMCATALRRLGYTVTGAQDGAAAVAAAAQGRFDLLFTDVVLPDMRGPEVARRVREHQPGIQVLFASGYTEDEIVRDGEIEADVNFLPKPYTPSVMARAVRELLDRARD